jgi:hypothetical protein
MTTYLKRRSTQSEWDMADLMLRSSHWRITGASLVLTPKQFQRLKAAYVKLNMTTLYITEGPPEGVTENDSWSILGSYVVVGTAAFLFGLLVGRK